MIKWLYIVIPAGFGLIAFVIMQPALWEDIGRGLILALSLLSAAVLVRLARGMPVSNTEYFDVDEIRRLSKAVMKVYRALIVLFAAAIGSIIGLAFVGIVHEAISKMPNLDAATVVTVQQILTALLVIVIAFALLRIIALIQGDYDLVQLQAKLMERAVERRDAARHIAKMDEADASKPFESRPGYGKLAQ